VYVEGIYIFGDKFGRRQKPDQENYRYPCSKALADTMVRGGWITDDSWSDEIGDFQFEFGGLQFEFVDGLYRDGADDLPDGSARRVSRPGVIDPRRIVDGPRDVEPLGPVVDAEVPAREAERHGVRRVLGAEDLARLGSRFMTVVGEMNSSIPISALVMPTA
jgi:hypothetical protein